MNGWNLHYKFWCMYLLATYLLCNVFCSYVRIYVHNTLEWSLFAFVITHFTNNSPAIEIKLVPLGSPLNPAQIQPKESKGYKKSYTFAV